MKIAVLCDAFPELSESFVVNEIAALRRQGHELRVIALGRPRRAHGPEGERVPLTVVADLGHAGKLTAMARLALTLRGWGVEHVHVHFAAGAAMEGLRLGAVLGVPVSVTAHAYDIFATPRNLERKLRQAAFVTTGRAANVAHLRALVGGPAAERVHEIVMGVDATTFRRTTPHPAQGTVLAIGRLVEKKGFADLVHACGLLRDDPAFTGLTLVGEGPLEASLRALVASLGLEGRVRFTGALAPEAVRGLLEDAAVLVMPRVVAADGDRDSMPVVVKEALAMEVPVVATDAVGLPEIVDASCGRLVGPDDPPAPAAALRELLRAGPAARAALGRAGRARVVQTCDVDAETRRLAGLIETARHTGIRGVGGGTGSRAPGKRLGSLAMSPTAEELCSSPASLRCLAALRDLTGEVGGPMERHSLRVVLLAQELARLGDHQVDAEVLVCAGLLHDIGLYPGAATKAAYVTDSRHLAETMLAEAGWPPERVRLAADAVEYHHELRSQWKRGAEVELMRRADLVEVSHGLIPAGIPKAFRQDLLTRIPRQGFMGEVLRGLGRSLRERPGSLWRIAKPT